MRLAAFRQQNGVGSTTLTTSSAPQPRRPGNNARSLSSPGSGSSLSKASPAQQQQAARHTDSGSKGERSRSSTAQEVSQRLYARTSRWGGIIGSCGCKLAVLSGIEQDSSIRRHQNLRIGCPEFAVHKMHSALTVESVLAAHHHKGPCPQAEPCSHGQFLSFGTRPCRAQHHGHPSSAMQSHRQKPPHFTFIVCCNCPGRKRPLQGPKSLQMPKRRLDLWCPG